MSWIKREMEQGGSSTTAELEAVAEGLEVLYPELADEFRIEAGLPVKEVPGE